jgi:hypothetical protein
MQQTDGQPNRRSGSVASTMNSEPKHKRIAALQAEMDAIHFANRLYWDQKSPSRDADSEHQQRQRRLEEIRKELSEFGM